MYKMLENKVYIYVTSTIIREISRSGQQVDFSVYSDKILL